jgi:hypothetical protein
VPPSFVHVDDEADDVHLLMVSRAARPSTFMVQRPVDTSVSRKTCASHSSSAQMRLQVCGLSDTMATFSPTSH